MMALLSLLVSVFAQAYTVNVDIFTDEDTDNTSCSLREAVRYFSVRPAAATLPESFTGYKGCKEATTDTTTGATVVLKAGTYTINDGILVQRTLSLNGAAEIDDADTTAVDERTILQSGILQSGIGNRLFVLSNASDENAILTISKLRMQGAGTVVPVGADKGYGGAILSARNVVLESVHLSGFKAQSGGAIYMEGEGRLTLTSSMLQNNRAEKAGASTDSNAGHGGAIYASGDIFTLTNSSLVGNTADVDGGAIYVAGHNSSSTLRNISNLTISGNTATNSGGAVFFKSAGSGAVLEQTLRNSTIVNNNATAVTGVDGIEFSGNTITLLNTLLAGNGLADAANARECGSASAAIISYSLLGKDGTTSCPAGVYATTHNILMDPSDVLNATPVLGKKGILGPLVSVDKTSLLMVHVPRLMLWYRYLDPLAAAAGDVAGFASYGSDYDDNAGTTPRLSPLVNRGNWTDCESQDARAVKREDGMCDIGAVEFRAIASLAQILVKTVSGQAVQGNIGSEVLGDAELLPGAAIVPPAADIAPVAEDKADCVTLKGAAPTGPSWANGCLLKLIDTRKGSLVLAVAGVSYGFTYTPASAFQGTDDAKVSFVTTVSRLGRSSDDAGYALEIQFQAEPAANTMENKSVEAPGLGVGSADRCVLLMMALLCGLALVQRRQQAAPVRATSVRATKNVVLLLITAFLLVNSEAAKAATIIILGEDVRAYDEDGSNTSRCTLREALKALSNDAAYGGCPAGSSAYASDTVKLGKGTYYLDPALGPLLVTGRIVIEGAVDSDDNPASRICYASSMAVITSAMQSDVATDSNCIYVAATATAPKRLLTLIRDDSANATGSESAVKLKNLRLVRGQVTGVISDPASARSGGIIYSYKRPVELINSWLRGGSALMGGGGAVYLDGAAGLTLNAVRMSDNSALEAGAVGMSMGPVGSIHAHRIDIAQSLFFSNSSTGASAGVVEFTGSDEVIIDGSTFTQNSSVSGAGVFGLALKQTGSASFTGISVLDNASISGPGAIDFGDYIKSQSKNSIWVNPAGVVECRGGAGVQSDEIRNNVFSSEAGALAVLCHGNGASTDNVVLPAASDSVFLGAGSADLYLPGAVGSSSTTALSSTEASPKTTFFQPKAGGRVYDTGLAIDCSSADEQRNLIRPSGSKCDIGSIEVQQTVSIKEDSGRNLGTIVDDAERILTQDAGFVPLSAGHEMNWGSLRLDPDRTSSEGCGIGRDNTIQFDYRKAPLPASLQAVCYFQATEQPWASESASSMLVHRASKTFTPLNRADLRAARVEVLANDVPSDGKTFDEGAASFRLDPAYANPNGGCSVGKLYGTSGSSVVIYSHGAVPLVKGKATADCYYLIRETGSSTDNPGVAHITIENSTPVAVSETLMRKEGQTLVIDVLANDFDPDQPALPVIVHCDLGIVSSAVPTDIAGKELCNFGVQSSPQFGRVSFDGNKLVYTPVTNTNPFSDSFTYWLKDDDGGMAQGTVTIKVDKDEKVGSGAADVWLLLLMSCLSASALWAAWSRRRYRA